MTVPLCVLCRTHPVDPRWRPFCSERCKWLDLSKWLDGEYRIPDGPVKEPDDDDDESDER